MSFDFQTGFLALIKSRIMRKEHYKENERFLSEHMY